MAKEMEAKIKLPDDHDFEEIVVDSGGIQKYSRKEVNIFYDTPAKKLNKKGEILRLRLEEYINGSEDISMTFKGRRIKGKLKIREEHEISISDFEQARLMLGSLGYKECFRFEKQRVSYTLDDCLIEFDTLPYLGNFVEVEGPNEKRINRVLNILGLDKEKLIVEGYGGLLAAYIKKNKKPKKEAMFRMLQP